MFRRRDYVHKRKKFVAGSWIYVFYQEFRLYVAEETHIEGYWMALIQL